MNDSSAASTQFSTEGDVFIQCDLPTVCSHSVLSVQKKLGDSLRD